ncbi:hypothetical protein LINPERPRIM_LOCUS18213 [Linum perenne]
MTRPSHWGAS